MASSTKVIPVALDLSLPPGDRTSKLSDDKEEELMPNRLLLKRMGDHFDDDRDFRRGDGDGDVEPTPELPVTAAVLLRFFGDPSKRMSSSLSFKRLPTDDVFFFVWASIKIRLAS